jgi:hypothetical protein
VANGVYDDLILGNLVENEKRVWRCAQTADRRIIRRRTYSGMGQEQSGDPLDSLLDAFRTAR